MKTKKKRIPSAIPIYAAALVWLLIGLILPKWLLSTGTFALTLILSVAAFFAAGLVFRGKEVEVREQADSGNAEIDRQIEEGRRQLDSLRAINAQLPDPVLTEKLNRIGEAGEAIFGVLEKNTSKANEVRRFMNYYLPTAEKLMRNYAELYNAPSRGENINSAMKSVENSLGMIADAFEKQLDSIYRDKSFDMSTDIKVLETILGAEGLTGARGADLRQVQEQVRNDMKNEPPKAQAGV